MSEKAIWILTEEVNDYHQLDGGYFRGVFTTEPTIKQLMYVTGRDKKYCGHIQKGGGRVEDEDNWYCLKTYTVDNQKTLSPETIGAIQESLIKYSTYLKQRSGGRIDVTKFKQAHKEFTEQYGNVVEDE